MRPNARQFRRHAREAGKRRAVLLRPAPAEQNRRPRAFDYRIDGLHNAPDADQNGLRWTSLDALRRFACAPDDVLIKFGRAIEADAMQSGSIGVDTFRNFARPEFLTPYSPIVALSLSPMPRSWNLPKAEPFRPSLVAQLLQFVLDHFPPPPTLNRPFNFG